MNIIAAVDKNWAIGKNNELLVALRRRCLCAALSSQGP